MVQARLKNQDLTPLLALLRIFPDLPRYLKRRETKAGRQLPRFLLAAWLLLSVAACAKAPLWYQEGQGQAEFDRDAEACLQLATAEARNQSISGNREDPFLVADQLRLCLYGQGWSPIPPEQRAQVAANPEAPALAVYQAGRIQGLGQTLAIPSDFDLISRHSAYAGATLNQTFSFAGPAGTYLNLIFQRTHQGSFAVVPYPVPEPFFLYAASTPQSRRAPSWAAFAGVFADQWVGGFGAYLGLNKRERITLVFTTALPRPTEPPPPGLDLAQNQYQAMEEFMHQSRTKLIDIFPPHPVSAENAARDYD